MDKRDDLRARVTQLEERLERAEQRHLNDRDAAAKDAARIRDLEAMLDTVPVGVVLAEAPSGRIVMGNRWVEEIVRHPVLFSDDVDDYGEWVSFHADGRRVQSAEYPLSRVIRDGEDESELDVHYRRGDGTLFWMRIIGRAITDGDGARTGAAVALIDIDDEIRLVRSQETLIGELDHRVKNAFAVVRSITSQSLRADGVDGEVRRKLEGRLESYARAHAALIDQRNRNVPVPMRQIVTGALDAVSADRFAADGPDVTVPPQQAFALAMALHELVTNALKYGALSVAGGKVSLTWAVQKGDSTKLNVAWREQNGPPVVEPSRTGFGSTILGFAFEIETGGTTDLGFGDQGLEWSASMTLGTVDDED